jgi:hypothetical protein
VCLVCINRSIVSCVYLYAYSVICFGNIFVHFTLKMSLFEPDLDRRPPVA